MEGQQPDAEQQQQPQQPELDNNQIIQNLLNDYQNAMEELLIEMNIDMDHDIREDHDTEDELDNAIRHLFTVSDSNATTAQDDDQEIDDTASTVINQDITEDQDAIINDYDEANGDYDDLENNGEQVSVSNTIANGTTITAATITATTNPSGSETSSSGTSAQPETSAQPGTSAQPRYAFIDSSLANGPVELERFNYLVNKSHFDYSAINEVYSTLSVPSTNHNELLYVLYEFHNNIKGTKIYNTFHENLREIIIYHKYEISDTYFKHHFVNGHFTIYDDHLYEFQKLLLKMSLIWINSTDIKYLVENLHVLEKDIENNRYRSILYKISLNLITCFTFIFLHPDTCMLKIQDNSYNINIKEILLFLYKKFVKSNENTSHLYFYVTNIIMIINVGYDTLRKHWFSQKMISLIKMKRDLLLLHYKISFNNRTRFEMNFFEELHEKSQKYFGVRDLMQRTSNCAIFENLLHYMSLMISKVGILHMQRLTRNVHHHANGEINDLYDDVNAVKFVTNFTKTISISKRHHLNSKIIKRKLGNKKLKNIFHTLPEFDTTILNKNLVLKRSEVCLIYENMDKFKKLQTRFNKIESEMTKLNEVVLKFRQMQMSNWLFLKDLSNDTDNATSANNSNADNATSANDSTVISLDECPNLDLKTLYDSKFECLICAGEYLGRYCVFNNNCSHKMCSNCFLKLVNKSCPFCRMHSSVYFKIGKISEDRHQIFMYLSDVLM